MRQKMAMFSTILGAIVSLGAALAMRDYVRVVDIVALFFGGVGTGAGFAMLVSARRSRRAAV